MTYRKRGCKEQKHCQSSAEQTKSECLHCKVFTYILYIYAQSNDNTME